MNTSFSLYELAPGKRGALVRIGNKGDYGYADLHPIPEFGDAPLMDHLKSKNTFLWKRAIYFAEQDRLARINQASLFQDKQIPESHFLVTNADIGLENVKGKTVKVKVGKDPSKEIPFLKNLASKNLKIRLDFNLRFDRDRFLKYYERIENLTPWIDFIEDPYPYSDDWIKDQKSLGVSFALDYQAERGIGDVSGCPILILKPAREDHKRFLSALPLGQRVIITSSLDHPLGQCAAMWVACQFPLEISGLLSHEVYPINRYASEFMKEGRRFTLPKGYGFGFDQLLEKEKWEVC